MPEKLALAPNPSTAPGIAPATPNLAVAFPLALEPQPDEQSTSLHQTLLSLRQIAEKNGHITLAQIDQLLASPDPNTILKLHLRDEIEIKNTPPPNDQPISAKTVEQEKAATPADESTTTDKEPQADTLFSLDRAPTVQAVFAEHDPGPLLELNALMGQGLSLEELINLKHNPVPKALDICDALNYPPHLSLNGAFRLALLEAANIGAVSPDQIALHPPPESSLTPAQLELIYTLARAITKGITNQEPTYQKKKPAEPGLRTEAGYTTAHKFDEAINKTIAAYGQGDCLPIFTDKGTRTPVLIYLAIVNRNIAPHPDLVDYVITGLFGKKQWKQLTALNKGNLHQLLKKRKEKTREGARDLHELKRKYGANSFTQMLEQLAHLKIIDSTNNTTASKAVDLIQNGPTMIINPNTLKSWGVGQNDQPKALEKAAQDAAQNGLKAVVVHNEICIATSDIPGLINLLAPIDPGPAFTHQEQKQLQQLISNNDLVTQSFSSGKFSRRHARQYLQSLDDQILELDEVALLSRAFQRGKQANNTLKYAKQIPLSTAEITALTPTAQLGERAEAVLTNCNLRLVVSIAKRYISRGLSFMELIQIGNLGLMKAIEKYNHHLGHQFSTHATWWIRHTITRALTDQTRVIRVSADMEANITLLSKTRKALIHRLGRAPLDEEIAAEMGIKLAKLVTIHQASLLPLSLEIEVGEDEDKTLEDFIKNKTTPDPEATAFHHILQEQLETALDSLTPIEALVLRLHFGLKDGYQYSYKEIGAKLGKSTPWATYTIHGALSRLRHPSRGRQLIDFLPGQPPSPSTQT